jgi:hypothetical protein
VASYVRTHLVLLAFAPGLVSGHPLASASCVVSIILTDIIPTSPSAATNAKITKVCGVFIIFCNISGQEIKLS